MAPSKAPSSWEDEESDSTPPSSPPVVAARRGKFDDEEDDEDVLDDWENDEDSEVEREKEKKAAEAKAKAEAEAKANHKSRAQRIEEKREEHLRKKREQEALDEEDSDEDEDEAERRARMRESEKAADLKNAEDLFAGIGVSDKRANKAITVTDDKDPGNAIDLSSMSLFKPNTAPHFQKLRDTLVPLLTANSKKPQYALFMQEFVKQLSKDLNSEQIKKVAGGLNTMANEKMKEEKAAEKGGKKTKAAKTKTTLNASRDVMKQPDTELYDDGLDDGDFM